jgi:NifU-like protein involved in Fe-S cluster formation
MTVNIENAKHDLKRCLSGISAATSLLKTKLVGDDLETANDILKECDNAIEIINAAFLKLKNENREDV